MSIEVGNIRDYIVGGKVKFPDDGRSYSYVGRAVNRYGLEESILHNPFPICPGRTRKHSIADYRGWFPRAIKVGEHYRRCQWRTKDTDMLDELARLRALAAQGDLLLLCWCHPKPCHASIIKEHLEAYDAT